MLPFVNVPGYDRDFFPTWEPVSGACNVRETVLKRDGTGVKTDSACKSTAGRWYSPYDGRTLTRADDVDIDHMVPLKNAWIVSLSLLTHMDRRWTPAQCSLLWNIGTDS